MGEGRLTTSIRAQIRGLQKDLQQEREITPLDKHLIEQIQQNTQNDQDPQPDNQSELFHVEQEDLQESEPTDAEIGTERIFTSRFV